MATAPTRRLLTMAIAVTPLRVPTVRRLTTTIEAIRLRAITIRRHIIVVAIPHRALTARLRRGVIPLLMVAIPHRTVPAVVVAPMVVAPQFRIVAVVGPLTVITKL